MKKTRLEFFKARWWLRWHAGLDLGGEVGHLLEQGGHGGLHRGREVLSHGCHTSMDGGKHGGRDFIISRHDEEE